MNELLITNINNQNITCNIDIPTNTTEIHLFPLSTIYTENANDNTLGLMTLKYSFEAQLTNI